MIIGILLGVLVIVSVCGGFVIYTMKQERQKNIRRNPDNQSLADEVVQCLPHAIDEDSDH